MITETIDFHFENEDQRRRFHAVLNGSDFRLLQRVLAVADQGLFRDGAGLGLHAHPVMDDIREALNASRDCAIASPSSEASTP
jgi:hypothetical protein